MQFNLILTKLFLFETFFIEFLSNVLDFEIYLL